MALSISELGERTGTSPDMLRYYGRLGLLAESGRTPAGHRYYDEAAVERVRFIKGAQWLDLRLGEIGELLAALDGEECPCGFSEELVRRRIAEIDQQRVRLDEMRALLSRLLRDAPPPADAATAGAAGQPSAEEARVGECGCCAPPGPRRTEDEIRELEARRAAVERRLRQVAGRVPGSSEEVGS